MNVAYLGEREKCTKLVRKSEIKDDFEELVTAGNTLLK